MDARNYVDGLIEKERTGGEKTRYDFIYEDALNDYSVPYQLTTWEFNDKLAGLLSDDGIYLIEMIDIYDSALFLGSFVNTLEKTFPFVYVVTIAEQPKSERNNFVIAASMHELDMENLETDYKKRKLKLWLLNKDEIEHVKRQARYTILTDDYAPVENLLAPVVKDASREILSNQYLKEAKDFEKKHEFKKAIAKYKQVIKFDPSISVQAYNNMAVIQGNQGNLKGASENLTKAIEFNDNSGSPKTLAAAKLNLAYIMERMQKPQQAKKYYDMAEKALRKDILDNPKSASSWNSLGDLYASRGNLAKGAEAFSKAVSLEPINILYYENLVAALSYLGRYDDAVKALQKGAALMNRLGRKAELQKLQQSIGLMQYQKSQKQ